MKHIDGFRLSELDAHTKPTDWNDLVNQAVEVTTDGLADSDGTNGSHELFNVPGLVMEHIDGFCLSNLGGFCFFNLDGFRFFHLDGFRFFHLDGSRLSELDAHTKTTDGNHLVNRAVGVTTDILADSSVIH